MPRLLEPQGESREAVASLSVQALPLAVLSQKQDAAFVVVQRGCGGDVAIGDDIAVFRPQGQHSAEAGSHLLFRHFAAPTVPRSRTGNEADTGCAFSHRATLPALPLYWHFLRGRVAEPRMRLQALKGLAPPLSFPFSYKTNLHTLFIGNNSMAIDACQ